MCSKTHFSWAVRPSLWLVSKPGGPSHMTSDRLADLEDLRACVVVSTLCTASCCLATLGACRSALGCGCDPMRPSLSFQLHHYSPCKTQRAHCAPALLARSLRHRPRARDALRLARAPGLSKLDQAHRARKAIPSFPSLARKPLRTKTRTSASSTCRNR